MISAEQARERAKEKLEWRLGLCHIAILKASGEGRYSIQFDSAGDPFFVLRLRELGYGVSRVGTDRDLMVVSW